MFIKRMIVLFFAFHFLSFGIFTIELAKIPFLFTHYYEHKEANKNLDFWNFMKMHYGSDSNTDTQLPFHLKIWHCANTVYLVNFHNMEVKSIYTFFEKKKYIKHTNILLNGFRTIILQPPKQIV